MGRLRLQCFGKSAFAGDSHSARCFAPVIGGLHLAMLQEIGSYRRLAHSARCTSYRTLPTRQSQQVAGCVCMFTDKPRKPSFQWKAGSGPFVQPPSVTSSDQLLLQSSWEQRVKQPPSLFPHHPVCPDITIANSRISLSLSLPCQPIQYICLYCSTCGCPLNPERLRMQWRPQRAFEVSGSRGCQTISAKHVFVI